MTLLPPRRPPLILSDAALQDVQQRNRDHPGWVLSPDEADALLLDDAERINNPKEKR